MAPKWWELHGADLQAYARKYRIFGGRKDGTYDDEYLRNQLGLVDQLKYARHAFLISVFALAATLTMLPITLLLNLDQMDDLRAIANSRVIDYCEFRNSVSV